MKHYVELDSQKYYQTKTKAEQVMLRRHQAGEAVKTFILSAIIVTSFTAACLALYQSPEIVLNAVEALKAKGLWPR